MEPQACGDFRPLVAADLAKVIEIDHRITGRSRHMFFEKRLEAALSNLSGFIAVAVETDGALTGFAIARLQEGEFGVDHRVAVLDVIGVDPEQQRGGQGQQLLEGIAHHMKKRGIRELRTQVDWHDRAILSFFGAAGFELAPRQVLERSVSHDL